MRGELREASQLLKRGGDKTYKVLGVACKHKVPSDGGNLEDIILHYKGNAQDESHFPGTHEEVRNLEHFWSEEELKRMLRKSGKLE
ncbi:hypothetical protein P5673_010849 [Acropora cervicornis]|uniref:Uncharacterized protein n=1 Tax=Acropora cervicornis TaxID=6130 RepID=A0AAD9QQK5_ACRCE|nr:hypothetical protein P5673_010849 [Acropora cervicornis]